MKESDREATLRADQRGERRAPAPSLLDRLRSVFGLGAASIRDDIEDALEESGAEQVFSLQERAMLRNVLGLHEIRVEDIMVPRANIIAVSSRMTLAEVLAVFRAAGHSRLPVHGDTLDDPRGMIHIRDFVDVLAGATSDPVSQPSAVPADPTRAAVTLATCVEEAEVTRPVLFVPPSMQALDLLVKMQGARTHMALVIDEYGGTDGLVSIEDIVEMIVGDIEDEHDEDEEPLIAGGPDGPFVADGRAALDDVSAALGHDLTSGDDADESDTIGGFVTSLCGHVPLRGEMVSGHDTFDFEILEADPRRVRRVRIHRRDKRPDPEAAASADVMVEPAPPLAAHRPPAGLDQA